MNFFKPYLEFLLGVSYNVMQTLEALGLWSTNFVVRDKTGKIVESYWSITEAIAVPFFVITIIFFVLVFVMLFAIRILAGKKDFNLHCNYCFTRFFVYCKYFAEF